MRQVGTWIKRHLGRRGSSLLFFCLIDLIIAWSLINPATTPLLRRSLSYSYIVRYTFFDHGPLWGWAGAWIIVGLICGVSAWLKERDAIAFALAIAMKIIWSGMFLAAWILMHAQGAWILGMTWAGFAAFVGIIAGWPEPIEHPPTQVDHPTSEQSRA